MSAPKKDVPCACSLDQNEPRERNWRRFGERFVKTRDEPMIMVKCIACRAVWASWAAYLWSNGSEGIDVILAKFKSGNELRATARGWPWQRVDGHWASDADRTTGEKFGWNPFKVKGMGRFGGGWAFKLGIIASRDLRDICIDLAIGSVRFSLRKPRQ
jgi:hypothetical protein